MKIGISNYPFTSKWNSLEELKKIGFSAIDYSISDTEIFLYTADINEVKEHLLNMKREADALGIVISQTHGPWRWPCLDGTVEERAERLEKMKRCILINEILDCKYMVIHPIMPFGTHDKEINKEKETHELNLAFMKELVAFAEAHGVVVCLENMPMPAFSLGTPREILAFVKEINSDNFKICLDTGHVATYKELSLSDEVRALGEYIKVLHVHDSIPERDMHLIPYFGKTNWSDFAKALREVSYDGYFSIEINPTNAVSHQTRSDIFKLIYKIALEIVEK